MTDYTHHLLFVVAGTAQAVREGRKDVTRRLVRSERDTQARWRVGARARCYERHPRAGGKPFGSVEILSVTREKLSWISANEVIREGARAKDPQEFIDLFRGLHCLSVEADPDPDVWRIVFGDFTPEPA